MHANYAWPPSSSTFTAPSSAILYVSSDGNHQTGREAASSISNLTEFGL